MSLLSLGDSCGTGCGASSPWGAPSSQILSPRAHHTSDGSLHSTPEQLQHTFPPNLLLPGTPGAQVLYCFQYRITSLHMGKYISRPRKKKINNHMVMWSEPEKIPLTNRSKTFPNHNNFSLFFFSLWFPSPYSYMAGGRHIQSTLSQQVSTALTTLSGFGCERWACCEGSHWWHSVL